jgi:hypothetical protein
VFVVACSYWVLSIGVTDVFVVPCSNSLLVRRVCCYDVLTGYCVLVRRVCCTMFLQGIGEPPLLASCSVFLALKEAITAARVDAGLASRFELNSPATVSRILLATHTA